MADKKQKQKNKPPRFASLKQRWLRYRQKSQISKTVSRVEAGKDVSTADATRAAGIIDSKTKRKQAQKNEIETKLKTKTDDIDKKINSIKNNLMKKRHKRIGKAEERYKTAVNKKYASAINQTKKQSEKQLSESNRQFKRASQKLESKKAKENSNIEKRIADLTNKKETALQRL